MQQRNASHCRTSPRRRAARALQVASPSRNPAGSEEEEGEGEDEDEEEDEEDEDEYEDEDEEDGRPLEGTRRRMPIGV